MQRLAQHRPTFLRPGPHIAAFLSMRCRLICLVIAPGHRLVGQYEIPGPEVDADQRLVDEVARVRLLEPGVHVAPWRGRDDEVVLLGIGGCHQLFCTVPVARGVRLDSAYTEVRALLDVIRNSDGLAFVDEDEDSSAS